MDEIAYEGQSCLIIGYLMGIESAKYSVYNKQFRALYPHKKIHDVEEAFLTLRITWPCYP